MQTGQNPYSHKELHGFQRGCMTMRMQVWYLAKSAGGQQRECILCSLPLVWGRVSYRKTVLTSDHGSVKWSWPPNMPQLSLLHAQMDMSFSCPYCMRQWTCPYCMRKWTRHSVVPTACATGHDTVASFVLIAFVSLYNTRPTWKIGGFIDNYKNEYAFWRFRLYICTGFR